MNAEEMHTVNNAVVKQRLFTQDYTVRQFGDVIRIEREELGLLTTGKNRD